MMGRIRKIRFRGNGQFFAMILAAPLLACLDWLLVGLIQFVFYFFSTIGGVTLEYIALALLYLLLPLALFLNLPRLREPQPAARAMPRKK